MLQLSTQIKLECLRLAVNLVQYNNKVDWLTEFERMLSIFKEGGENAQATGQATG